MKSAAVLLYILFASAHPAGENGLQKRQQQPSPQFAELISQPRPSTSSLDPVKFVEVDSDIRAGAKKVVARYGPFVVPPSKAAPGMGHSHGLRRAVEPLPPPTPSPSPQSGRPMDPNGFQIRSLLRSGFCSNCTILRARALVTDATGQAMGIGSGVYLHHIVVSPVEPKRNPDPWGACQGVALQQLPNRSRPQSLNSFLIVQGVENFTTWYTTPDGKFDSGFHIPALERNKTASQLLTGEFVNYKNLTQNVYLTMEYDYTPGVVGGDAFMSLLSVLGCSLTAGPSAAGLGFSVPKGKSSKSSRIFTIQQDGTIINARAHMHDGGKEVKLYINEKLVCDSIAEYGGSDQATMVGLDGKKWETISGMKECKEPIKVKKGDGLRMEAFFDTDAHPVRSSGEVDAEEMGIYFFTFVADRH